MTAVSLLFHSSCVALVSSRSSGLELTATVATDLVLAGEALQMGCGCSSPADCVSFADGLVSLVRSLECLLGPCRAVARLKTNRDNLFNESSALWGCRNDLEDKIRRLETETKLCKEEIRRWFESVDTLQERVDQFLDDLDKLLLAGGEGCSPPSLCRRCWLTMEVADFREQVDKLLSKGTGFGEDELVREVPPDPPREITRPEIIGRETLLEEIKEHLTGDSKGIIGVYGMGGVGKTTLLETIEYDFSTSSGFDLVIRVDLSRQADANQMMRSIRQEICRRLRVTAWRPKLLRENLKGKKFLLLLDNVWGKVPLTETGVPTPDRQNLCKVVLATRLYAVCRDMCAHAIKVGVLADEKAKLLFKQTIDNDQLLAQDGIQNVVEPIVSECGGLPLALEIVAGAMANKTTLEGWQGAAKKLKESPHLIEGMKDKLFDVLNFSFEHLDKYAQQCFLYCSLFPEQHDISKRLLVEYWIGEGLLDYEDNEKRSAYRGRNQIENARVYSDNVIQQLLDSCLLESYIGKDVVRMHDVLRDFALWKAERTFLVHDMTTSSRQHVIACWKEAERISLMQSRTTKFPEESKCSKLLTLLVNKSNIQKVPEQLFVSMSNLQVLDLSGTHIEQLPNAISNLYRLRHLNLSNTPVKSLPKEMRYLVKLKQLNLSYTSSLETFPYKAISNLSSLWTLNLFHSGYDKWEPDDSCILFRKRVNFADLEQLPALHELGFSVNKPSIFTALWNSHLLTYMTSLCLKNLSCNDLSVERMKCLQELHISQFPNLSKLTFRSEELPSLQRLKLVHLPNVDIDWIESHGNRFNVCYLDIVGCHKLKNLTWVQHLLFLEEIFLANCNGLEEVIENNNNNERNRVSFDRLKCITLRSLHGLKNICQCPTKLPSLESLTVYKCSSLTTIPIGDDNVKRIQICGDENWWKCLQWKSNEMRTKSQPCFKDARYATWMENEYSCS